MCPGLLWRSNTAVFLCKYMHIVLPKKGPLVERAKIHKLLEETNKTDYRIA